MENKIEIIIGDLFVYKSKYGGVIKDTITDIFPRYTVNLEDGYICKNYDIKSSKGVWYKLDEVVIVSEFLSKEKHEKMLILYEKIKEDVLKRKTTSKKLKK